MRERGCAGVKVKSLGNVESQIFCFKAALLPIAFSNHFRSTVFNVIRMKSKNKFVTKRRAAHQIMLLSKFANGTFS